MREIPAWDIEAIEKRFGEGSALELFKYLGTEERHFNELQVKYRLMASGWLLATFGGIGFALTTEIGVGVPRGMIVMAISAAGAFGVALLWVIDQLVYHRLLDACFVEGLKLELAVPELPPFRHNMMRLLMGEGVLFRTVGFYLGPFAVCVVMAGAGLVLGVHSLDLGGLAPYVAALTFLIAWLACATMFLKTENTAGFVDLLERDSRLAPNEESLPPSRPSPAILRAVLFDFPQRATAVAGALVLCLVLLLALAFMTSTSEPRLDSKPLTASADYIAPDGSEVRLLVGGSHGSMAHFTLPPNEVSQAVAHHTVEELWYFVAGSGQMWRKLGSVEDVLEVEPGVSINVPVGTHFQFRSSADAALEAVAVSMPPWPGAVEAYAVEGRWAATTPRDGERD